jgi:hypothetical protein
MPFAAAGAIAGVASAGIGLASSLSQKGAVAGGQSSANAAQTAALEQARNDLGPWRTAGGNALGVAGDLSGANGIDAARAAQGNFLESPGYQWQLGEGLRAVDAGAAAKGMLRSGATIKAEEAYGQGLAKQDFANYYNRLFDLSKLGESAATGSAAADVTTGQGIAQTNASAAGQQSSIYGNLGQGLSSTVNGLFSNPQVASYLGGLGSGSNYNPNSTAFTDPSQFVMPGSAGSFF